MEWGGIQREGVYEGRMRFLGECAWELFCWSVGIPFYGCEGGGLDGETGAGYIEGVSHDDGGDSCHCAGCET
jgi:hypothetical protein